MKCSTFVLFLFIFLLSCQNHDRYYYVDGCIIEPDRSGQTLTCGPDTLSIPDRLPVLNVLNPCGEELLVILEGNLYLFWHRSGKIDILEDFVTYKVRSCRFKIVNGILEIL